MTILVTGSSGLVGGVLARALADRGDAIRLFDIRRSASEDVRNPAAMAAACEGVEGIVHLAAVSRVVTAQRDPAQCRAVNEGGLENLVAALRKSGNEPPWLVFASSREVYGQQDALPVHEDAELRPCNVYARSKVFGERLTFDLRDEGLVTAVVRLSNVYGKTSDHADRVVPAFARAVAFGGGLRVDGADNMLDITHVADVVRGIMRLVDRVRMGDQLPPIHLTSGIGTTLSKLAQIACDTASRTLEVRHAEPRDYDVARFCGRTERARELLDWETEISVKDGFRMLVREFELGA